MRACYLFQWLISIVALGVVVVTYTLRDIKKIRFYQPLALATFFFAMGYALELYSIAAHDIAGVTLAVRVQYYGIAPYAVLYYLFIRDFGNRELPSRWVVVWLFAYPVVLIALFGIAPQSTLLFEDIRFLSETSERVIMQRGLALRVSAMYSMALMLASIYEILRYYKHARKEDRKKRMVLVITTGVLVLSIVFLVVDIVSMQINLCSAAMVIILLVQGTYLFKKRPQDWLPYARNMILQEMSDAYILLDVDGCFLDANERAQSLFPYLRSLKPGDFNEGMDKLPAGIFDMGVTSKEILVTHDGEECWLRAQSTPIHHHKKPICLSVMLYDITDEKRSFVMLKERVARDALTGLLERGTFMELADKQFYMAYHSSLLAVLIMLDIDRFKVVNDTYGHIMGDRVLRRIAELLLTRIRKTDLCGRYGGEEFIIFMPSTDAMGARLLADDIRMQVSNVRFDAGGNTFGVTLSAGIVVMDHHRHKSLNMMIADADHALYLSKNSGRDRVTLFTEK